jgi:MFS superfamily sulfate permease-like transporter
MALENITANISLTDILPSSVTDKFSFLLQLGKYALVIIIAYLLILIIFKILSKIKGYKDSKNLQIIADGVAEINSKLGLLVPKSKKK